MKVLVTGANGFIGKAVIAELNLGGFCVRAAVRRPLEMGGHLDELVAIDALDPDVDWRPALRDVTAIVHLAARVHHTNDASQEATYRRENVDATIRLAEQAKACGVRRFVFMSSAKVHGEYSEDHAFSETDSPAPRDHYARSKWRAEQALSKLAMGQEFDVVVLRPPLVYGPGVKANFLRLLDTIERGWPIPLGAIRNKRSLIYLGNLANAVATCLTHANAAGKTYLVSDGEDLSTPGLIRRLAHRLQRPARLVYVPGALLHAGAALLGRRADFDRVAGDFRIDSGAIRRDLSWAPPLSLDQSLEQTARWYRGLVR